MNEVFAFECTVVGTDWHTIINARNKGKAKYKYWLDVKDVWADVPFTAVRVRKIGKPVTTEGFERTARYRGMPDAKCGQRVRVGSATGVIVGSNSSANFDILFDNDSERYPGLRLNVHPADIELI
jgi:hypothetical protein